MADTDDVYVALLRGINVGGANLIPMTALRASFESLGFRNVASYIQSGNVVFRAPKGDPRRLATRVEKALSGEFGYDARIVLRSLEQMRRVVHEAPRGFGSAPGTYAYAAIFLRAPVVAGTVLPAIRLRDGVDRAYAGDGVIYFSRLISRASQSQMSRLVLMPEYKQMTIRNWNTTTKLLALMER